MKKVMQKVIITLICLTLIVGAFGCDKGVGSTMGEYYGLFGYAPDTGGGVYKDYSEHLSKFSAQIEAGMAADATDEEKVLAAYILYRVACLADATAPQRAKYSVGSGSATGNIYLGEKTDDSKPIEVTGGMNMTSTYYDVKYPFVAPASVEDLAANYKCYSAKEEYTQIPENAVTSSMGAVAAVGEPILRAVLPFARRGITTPEYSVTWNGDQKSAVISEGGVVGSFEDKKKQFSVTDLSEAEDTGISREYGEDWYDEYGLTSHDMSTHIINLKTIVPSSVVITRKTGETVKGKSLGFYEVDFAIDTETDRGTEDSATYYAEQMYISQAPDVFINYLSNYAMNYTQLEISMSVYDSGYFRTWGTEETWQLTGEVTGIAFAELISYCDSTEAFCYDSETIMQGFVNRYFGDSSNVNLPASDLPFYTEYSKYTAQAYGTYR